jgi:DNA-binding beta-propeller fold protein YncE
LCRFPQFRFQDTCGIAFSNEGDAYITDYAYCDITKVSPMHDFERIAHVGRPWYLSIDHKQNLIFVVDAGNHRIQVLNLKGKNVREWRIESYSLRGVAVNEVGEVAVTATNPQRNDSSIHVFDFYGIPLRSFGNGKQFFAIVSDQIGHWFASDNIDNCVNVFRNDGALVTSFDVRHPRGICIDGDGRVLVCSGFGVRVFVF